MVARRLSASSLVLVATLGGFPGWGAAQPVAGHESAGAPTGSEPVLRAVDRSAIEQRWGIRIEGIRLTAGGYMLDFRYRVVDATLAAPLFDRGARAVLTDERTGAVMAVPVPPKTGPLRSTNDPKPGRSYFMFFANPGRFIAKYSRVTVAIGDFRVSGLTVGP